MVSEHPSPEELAALCDGGLSPARERKALRATSALERHMLREQAKARKIFETLKKDGSKAVDTIPASVGPMARMIAFMSWSWELRYEDPQQMVQYAHYAATLSLKLNVGRYGLERVFDHQARAHAELGNAYRVHDQLQQASDSLGHARALFECGTGDEVLEVRLLELEASLAADCRQFGRASKKLLDVYKFYDRQNDSHFIGRTLIKIGLYTGYAGGLEKGIDLLNKGLTLIDAKIEPSLAYAAAHNLVLFLVDSENFKEARKLRLVHARHLAKTPGQVNAVKFRALDGRIDAGLGNHARAAKIFREVQQGYEKVGRYYDSAITALDLAAVLLPQGKAVEAAAVSLKASETFKRLGIQREALQAVILLRDAFKQQNATLEMVKEVIRFLELIKIDPTLRFEGRAWERSGPSPDGLP